MGERRLDILLTRVISDLVSLIIQLSDSIHNAKWVVSSRNWPTIEQQFDFTDKVEVSLELNQNSGSKAVDMLINQKISRLARLKRYSEDTIEAVLRELHRKADENVSMGGLGLRRAIKTGFRSWNTIEQLNSMPRGLEKPYDRMLQQILSSRNSTLCGQILANSIDKSLKSLVKDACRFVLTFRHAFELAPLQVYVSALVFSPTSSVVKGLYQTDQPAWINLNSEPPSDWDTCTQILEGKNTLFDAIALAPDGHTLASLSDNQLKLWDTEKGCCIYCCEWKTSYFDRLAFSPNGKQLAALDRNDRTISRIVLLNLIVPSVNSDKPFLNLDSNPDFEDIEDFNATAIVFSPSGLRLAASSTNASAKIWDPSTRRCVRTMTRPSFPMTNFHVSHTQMMARCLQLEEGGMVYGYGPLKLGSASMPSILLRRA
uniref:Anaphase-promoting complex subunit 4 WD40 domain-containing protein n=1 Tax=Bionectria ochroleuca TaxID=29856 RepID=A0A8H7K2N9_BIOOC